MHIVSSTTYIYMYYHVWKEFVYEAHTMVPHLELGTYAGSYIVAVVETLPSMLSSLDAFQDS